MASKRGQVAGDGVIHAVDKAFVDGHPDQRGGVGLGHREGRDDAVALGAIEVLLVHHGAVMEDDESLGVMVGQERFPIAGVGEPREQRRHTGIGRLRKVVGRGRGGQRALGELLPVKGIRLLPDEDAINVLGRVSQQGQGQDKQRQAKDNHGHAEKKAAELIATADRHGGSQGVVSATE
jgi:hypothetical protein